MVKDERTSIATNAKDAAIARPLGRRLIRDCWVLRSIDMVLPFCCARCVAAEVRRVHKRAMKDDVKAEARMTVSRASEFEIHPSPDELDRDIGRAAQRV